MSQRRMLDDNEWTGWLQWMRTCFQRGTMSQIWKHFQDGAFDPNFQKFLNAEIIGGKPLKDRIASYPRKVSYES
jgi:hypothetical protein